MKVSIVDQAGSKDYIVFLGSACIDEYYAMEHWPKKGEKAMCRFDRNQFGGMIANAACTAAAYGLKCYCFDIKGNDGDTQAILDDLNHYGIDTSQMVLLDGVANTKCMVFVHPDERTILIARGDESEHAVDLNDAQREFFRNARFLYGGFDVERIIRGGESFLGELRENGVDISFDVEPTSYREDWRGVAKFASILFFNEFSFDLFSEGKSEEEFSRELFDMGVKIVVMTLGSDGCRVLTREKRLDVPIYEGVVAVDTTGAGDTFNSSFVSAYIMGWDLEKSALFATAAANMAVMTYGPRGGVRGQEEVLDFMRTHSLKQNEDKK